MMVAGLGLGSNVAVGLWARSTVEAVAYDTARRIAETPRSADVTAQSAAALRNARSGLGPLAAQVDLRVLSTGPDDVDVLVRYPGVRLVPRLVRAGPVVGAIDRTLTVRREGRT
jgi:hypothetical protein